MKQFITFFSVLFFIFIIGCNENEDIYGSDNAISSVDDALVTLETAKDIALRIGESNLTFKGSAKSISSAKSIGTLESKPSFHIINYENGGFIIISGDKRMTPILAYSNDSHFNLNDDFYPNGLVSWMKKQDEETTKIRVSKDTVFQIKKEEWKLASIEKTLSADNYNNGMRTLNVSCNDLSLGEEALVFSNGPFLSTTWGQGLGYNNLAPNYNCSDYSNGRTPTGCVATAMAQIMRFYEHPSNYNWNIMPNSLNYTNINSQGANEISRLMRDAGNSVSMDWGCDGSSANTSRVPNALKNNFGYSSADLGHDGYLLHHDDLKNGYPVILSGGEKGTRWLIFNVYENGHAWVSDGIRIYLKKIRMPVPRHGYQIVCRGKTYTHMNWGWNGSYNGWYSSFNVNNYNFDFRNKSVRNIRN